MNWLCVTEEEFEEIIFGLQTIISDRAGSQAEREGTEALIESLKVQASFKVSGPASDAIAQMLLALREEGQQGG